MKKTKSQSEMYFRRAPGEYPATPQQRMFREALDYCGIQQGIPKGELMKQMKECIPRFYKERKKGEVK